METLGFTRSPNIPVVVRNMSDLLLEKGKMNYNYFKNQNRDISFPKT